MYLLFMCRDYSVGFCFLMYNQYNLVVDLKQLLVLSDFPNYILSAPALYACANLISIHGAIFLLEALVIYSRLEMHQEGLVASHGGKWRVLFTSNIMK
jgi:hypothetical protein